MLNYEIQTGLVCMRPRDLKRLTDDLAAEKAKAGALDAIRKVLAEKWGPWLDPDEIQPCAVDAMAEIERILASC